MVKAVAVSSKHRPTNTPTPSSTRPASSAPTTLASTSSTSSATSTHRQMPNVPRPPARKLMPSEALGRYLTYEDRRDRSFMALLAAFSTVNNQALCVKELVDVVRDSQLLSLGGATPSGTINSAIRNHINRCVERQLPCLLSRHILSGDASDARLSPAIGVKPHHRSRAPPIVVEPSAGSPSTTPHSFAQHAAASLLGSASVNVVSSSSTSSPTSPLNGTSSSSSLSWPPAPASVSSKAESTSTPITRPPSPHPVVHTEKVYLKNKNGRTRKGVCLWYLSPWTGFENPFIREGFGDIGFQTDGKVIEDGETLLSPEDFQFRWVGPGGLAALGLGPGGPFAAASAQSSVPATPVEDVKSGSSSFFPNTTITAASSLTATDLITPVPSLGRPKAPNASSASSKASSTAGGRSQSQARFLPPLQIPMLGYASKSKKQQSHSLSSARKKKHDLSLSRDVAPKPKLTSTPTPLLPPSPTTTAPSTIDASSDVEIDMDVYSSDNAASASGASSHSSVSSSSSSSSDEDESDAESEAVPGLSHQDDEDRMSEAAFSTVDEAEAENFQHFALSWGEDDDDADASADEQDTEGEDEDQDGSLIITPRGSVVDTVAEVNTSSSALAGWSDFAAASVAMTMELSVGLNDSASGVAFTKRPGHRRVDSLPTPPTLFLNIQPRHHQSHLADEHGDLASPFTPLSAMSAHDSPSPASSVQHHQPSVLDELHMEDLGMDLGIGMDMNLDLDDLAAQNGDERRAAEDDILIDIEELLDDGRHSSGALPLLHEFEEAWGNGNERERTTRYPVSPEPSEPESRRRPRSYSYSRTAGTMMRASSPISIPSSHHQPQPRQPLFRQRRRASHQLRQTQQQQREVPRSINAGLSSPVSISSSLPSKDAGSALPSAHAISTPAGTPGRMYCPGMCVPMHRPQSRAGATTPTLTDEGVSSVTISQQLPSTPPRTPSPSPLSRSHAHMMMMMDVDIGLGSSCLSTPQAELDSLIVPGAAVSESPLPPSLLLPAEDPVVPEQCVDPTATTVQPDTMVTTMRPGSEAQNSTATSALSALLPISHQQLSQIVIPTLQPSNPPICATFVDGTFVYTLTDPATGHRLLRAVDTDYVHLSSLIAISQPPLSPSDALRIISLCHNPTIISPSFSPSTSTITQLAGSWVPLEDARQLCLTQELNIPVAVGQLFLEQNLGELYFPEPLPEWCRSRQHLREPGVSLGVGIGAGVGLQLNGMAVANANVSAMAALAELARMSGIAAAARVAAAGDEITPAPPAIADSALAPTSALLASLETAALLASSPVMRSQPHMQAVRTPKSPAMSMFPSVASHVAVSASTAATPPPSFTRSLSSMSMSSASSTLTSPPMSPPPPEVRKSTIIAAPTSTTANASSASKNSFATTLPLKKRGPGRPRKDPSPSDLAKAAKKQRARNVAAAAPATSRTERATARSLRSVH